MPQTDLPLEQLREYRSQVSPPADLDEFWKTTLNEAASIDLAPIITPIENGLAVIDTYDVTFRGYGGHPIRAWLHRPRGVAAPLPGVVQYMGYNGGRGLPHEHIFWACAGYAHLVMDTRGQGSGWSVGATGDPAAVDGPTQPGFLTRGITDPADHFYRRVYVDAVRAVEVLRGQSDVDSVVVTGASQGGGIAIAVAALAQDLAAAMPDVPFLCDFPRAARVTGVDPYGEIGRYLAAHRDQTERVFRTLSYFDGAVLATLATTPALFSVALMDQICPPSTVFGAYHNYAGRKELRIYEFNDHEGGQAFHRDAQLGWLAVQARAPYWPASGKEGSPTAW